MAENGKLTGWIERAMGIAAKAKGTAGAGASEASRDAKSRLETALGTIFNQIDQCADHYAKVQAKKMAQESAMGALSERLTFLRGYANPVGGAQVINYGNNAVEVVYPRVEGNTPYCAGMVALFDEAIPSERRIFTYGHPMQMIPNGTPESAVKDLADFVRVNLKRFPTERVLAERLSTLKNCASVPLPNSELVRYGDIATEVIKTGFEADRMVVAGVLALNDNQVVKYKYALEAPSPGPLGLF